MFITFIKINSRRNYKELLSAVTFKKRSRTDEWAGELSFVISCLLVLFDFSGYRYMLIVPSMEPSRTDIVWNSKFFLF